MENYITNLYVKNESKANMEHVKKTGKKMTEEQKNNFAKYKKEWKLLNRDRLNKEYRNKVATDINFRLRKNISRAINHALKKMLSKKNSSIIKFLPYSIEELKKHLEKQFDNSISWQNYGSYWQIDHIIPQSCLPYTSMSEENFRKCWELNNLRPLEAKVNMHDGSTRIRHKMYLKELSDE